MKPQLAPAESLHGSNLAFALRCLPRERRSSAAVFYRFCRAVDDIADDPFLEPAAKEEALLAWNRALHERDGLPGELAAVIGQLRIDPALLAGIVEGCRRDIFPKPFQTLDDLRGYCWHVACEVGLVSVHIFGCKDPASRDYAIHLGYALQFTNIVRDVGEDASSGRVYLPQDMLGKWGCGVEDVLAGDPRILPAARALAAHAGEHFQRAHNVLPPTDKEALLPARIMAAIYQTLLHKILRNETTILHRRVRLSRLHKALIFARVALLQSNPGGSPPASW
jgi:15-cis-phytoene synthase